MTWRCTSKGAHLLPATHALADPCLCSLSFANGTFPVCHFPPYCDPNTHLPPPADMTITPYNSYETTAWLAGVRILPAGTGSNYTTVAGVPLGPGHQVEVVATGNVTDILGALEATYLNGTGPSGINLGVTGIGAVHLATEADNLKEGFVEPPIVTTVRSSALGIINILAVSPSISMLRHVSG